MTVDARGSGARQWTQLLRRAHVIVEHHRYRGQPVDAAEVVRRVLSAQPAGGRRYRALLEEAVGSLLRGFR